ncbi:non-ribosomal peptide synthetase [Williamsia soli]|uniref:non-ribosomal peptide synthetase n=1 Tax=Williamsia soli TaxID=364929 RepID=UPI001A9D6DFD|nr:non-ribosomal peptide synthetase [Williamsia soli]
MSEDVIARRKELLRRRLRERGLSAETAPVPVRVPGERSPLAPGQQRLWFVQHRDPADTTLNVCVAYRLTGALDPNKLRATVNAVVERHEILRTSYGVDDSGTPYQVAAAHVDVPWSEHDLSELPEQGRARRLEVLARRQFSRSFDLSSDALLRISLVRTDVDEWAFIFVVHHICWDDDSWEVFFGEVNAAYNAGSEPQAPTAQFVDVEVLGRRLSEVDDTTGIEYWRSKLRPPPEWLELPAENAGPAAKTAGHGRRDIPSEVIDAVTRYAREQSSTPFAVLLAAFNAVVNRYTGSDDFLVAVPIVDRAASAQSLIGYFGNSLLLRSSVRPDGTFADLVAATRDEALGGFAHQHIGVDRVVREINPDRVSGSDGLEHIVRLSFSTRKSAVGFALDDVRAEQLELTSSVTQLPLGLTVVLGDDGAHVEAEYFADVLDGRIVDRMLAGYVDLLRGAVAEPDRRIGELDILGDERAEVIERSLGEQVPSAATTLPAMIEARVAAHPDHPAVTDDHVVLTYQDLNCRANRLAHWLIGTHSIGPEDIVALEVAASVEFVVAATAVLKAGAAYLPIDPSYPGDRIAFMIEDANPKLVLGAAELAAAERAAGGLSVADPVDADRVTPLLPEALAYVIYTSGSTGKPKGVSVPHVAIADHLSGFHAQFGMTADDRLVQTSSVSFDASLFEVFCTLTLGATLVVPKPDALQDIPYMADLLVRQRVTVMHMVPSMLSMFLLLPGVNEWTTLRQIPVGGEALPGEVADKFGTVFDAQLRNNYGPTEAVVAATHYPVDGPQGVRVVPIGVPNRNVSVYLLDRTLQLVPAGVVGEIYIGGDQLARSYHGRPALTAERFVADPMRPGGRLYRTGDLARRNVDGDIEFVGRADEQVKIRGFRIELGEVEAALSTHPAVARALVIVTEDPNVGPALAAYLVGERGAVVDIDSVREHATAVLPDYMVPSAFAVIDEVPLTAHGKLDRDALPDPADAAPRVFRAPATGTEIRVAALFTQLFGRDSIGADDSFFELGGHSLLAARLVTQIRTEFGVDIDVRAPFDTPTVAGLASWLVAQVRDEFGIDLDAADDDYEPIGGATTPQRPPLVKRDRPERVPLSYSQLAMWFARRFEGASAVGNIPMAVRIDGPVDATALTAAMGDVVARHEALRTTFPEHEGIPYQLIGPIASVPLPITVLGGESVAESEMELAAHLEAIAQYNFAVESEPLLRAHLFVLGDDAHVLSILVHHMVIDHWSFGVLLSDLGIAYRHRLAHGTGPDWVQHPIEYADYALWQRDLFDGDGASVEVGAAQIDYWRTTLSGAPDEITVAPDHPRPAVLGKTGEVVSFSVPAELRTRLREMADTIGVSEFMVLQSAVATLLHKLGGGDDIAIGTPVAGRTDEVTTDLVGLFANMVVLRNILGGELSLREVLLRGRDVALGAYSNQDVPIERLVEALNPRRSRSRNPLFQVMMHFRDDYSAPDSQAFTESGDTTLTLLPVEFETSFLDLNIIFASQSGGGLGARLVAAGDLYTREGAELLAARLMRVLAAFADDVDQQVRRMDVQSPDERERVLGTYSRGADVTPGALAARLSAVGRQSPDSVAVVRGSQSLTYGELRSGDAAGFADVREVFARAAGGDGPASTGGPDAVDGPVGVRLIAASPASPAGTAELLAGLAGSATVVLATDAERDDPVALAHLIARHSAERVVAEPEVLALLAHSGTSVMPSVRSWVASSPGGPASLAEVLSALSERSTSHYYYAPADFGSVAVVGQMGGKRSGRPAPGASVLILDQSLAPTPVGVFGEVYLAGTETAVGEWVSNPYAPGSRLLRSGDRAKWDHDGRLIFEITAADVAVAGVGGGGEAPQTATEKAMCDLLGELLEIDDVGRDDNFFALGGDSVISIQMAGRAAADGLPLTPQMIFDHHSIAELAAAIDDALANPPVEVEAAAEPVTLTYAPMSASGLSDDALAALTANWKPGS